MKEKMAAGMKPTEIPAEATPASDPAVAAAVADKAIKPITKEGIEMVIGAAKEDPNAVKMEYSSHSMLTTGLKTDVELPGGLKFIVDEPETMPGGANAGP